MVHLTVPQSMSIFFVLVRNIQQIEPEKTCQVMTCNYNRCTIEKTLYHWLCNKISRSVCPRQVFSGLVLCLSEELVAKNKSKDTMKCPKLVNYAECHQGKCRGAIIYIQIFSQYTNIPIYQYTNIPIYQYTNIPIYQYTNIPIYNIFMVDFRWRDPICPTRALTEWPMTPPSCPCW